MISLVALAGLFSSSAIAQTATRASQCGGIAQSAAQQAFQCAMSQPRYPRGTPGYEQDRQRAAELWLNRRAQEWTDQCVRTFARNPSATWTAPPPNCRR